MSESQRFKRGLWYSLAFIFVLWSVEAFEQVLALDLRELGILPRTFKGTIGIITGPLVHGDIFHLISNTFPLVILGIGIFYFYNKIALEVILLIYFMTGLWVWLIAREAYHIGASGVIYGLLSFMFFSGLLRKDPKTLAVSLILLFIYGGNMIYGIFPINEGISWESHFLGAISGLFCAIFFRKVKSSVAIKEALGDEDEQIEEPEYFDNHEHFKIPKTGFNYFYKLRQQKGKSEPSVPEKKKNQNPNADQNTYLVKVNKDKLI